MLGLWHTLL